METAVWKWEGRPIEKLDRLPKSMRNRFIRIALNKASGIVKEAVVSNAPKRYSFLARAQRIRLRNYKARAVWVAVIGASSKFKKFKGKIKRGPFKGQPIPHRPSKYGRLVELGTKFAQAKPYLKPALNQKAAAFAHAFTQKLKVMVEAELHK